MSQRFVVIIGVIVLLFFLSLSFIGGFVVAGLYYQGSPLLTPGPATTAKSGDFKLLREIYGQVRHAYVEKVSGGKLIDGAADGMLKALKDPYSRRLHRSDFHSFQEQTSGQFGGVGIELGMRDSKLTVVAPIKNTPADRAGIQPGDHITAIDGKTTEDMPLEKAVKLIRGDEGTKVRLNLERPGKKFAVSLVRERIKLPNVSSKMLDGKIGYINVHAFNIGTGKDVKTELDELKNKGAKGIIVDLRNNPGGLLEEAVAAGSDFIRSGPIVRVRTRSGRTNTFPASGDGDASTPLVVLVNHGSASASEIFAGAVQDVKRGPIIGEKTFGKGSVQTVITLSDGSGLVLTTAKYLTPKNRVINKRGVKPDIVVKMKVKHGQRLLGPDDAQLNRAKQVLEDMIAGRKWRKAS